MKIVPKLSAKLVIELLKRCQMPLLRCIIQLIQLTRDVRFLYLQVTTLYTAPTAVRALMAFGDEYVKPYNRLSLRLLGSVGEPINPAAWKWLHEVVKCEP